MRSPAELRHHYEVERELATRLRVASREERRSLYRTTYDELYRRVPLHPQLVRRDSADLTKKALAHQLRLLAPYLTPATRVLEIGPGDCSLSVAIAPRVREVYALDVSTVITRVPLPANVHLVLSDGTSIPLPPASIDLAYSNQLMEHLHPDDALDQLTGIVTALRPGGAYICVTPNRLSGPHDISKYFDREPTGFHLKEYTVGELVHLFHRVGFQRSRVLALGRLSVFPEPYIATEFLLSYLPQLMVRWKPCRAMLGTCVMGVKSA